MYLIITFYHAAPLMRFLCTLATQVVTGENGTICGLLGASPGASTCVSIGPVLDCLEVMASNIRSCS